MLRGEERTLTESLLRVNGLNRLSGLRYGPTGSATQRKLRPIPIAELCPQSRKLTCAHQAALLVLTRCGRKPSRNPALQRTPDLSHANPLYCRLACRLAKGRQMQSTRPRMSGEVISKPL